VARDALRLDLEGVVPVEVPAPQQGTERRQEVRGQERDAPSLPLIDVDELVLENALVDVVDAQHDVTKGHRPMPETDLARPIGTLKDHDPSHDAPAPEEGRHQKADDRAG